MLYEEAIILDAGDKLIKLPANIDLAYWHIKYKLIKGETPYYTVEAKYAVNTKLKIQDAIKYLSNEEKRLLFEDGVVKVCITNEIIASLYDGGRRTDDLDQLISKYDITQEEAEIICKRLAEMEVSYNG